MLKKLLRTELFTCNTSNNFDGFDDAGDNELNPGSKRSGSCCNFSMCHWNLNSIAAHDFSKLRSLEAHNNQHKFNLICLSEIYLDFSIQLKLLTPLTLK